MQCKHCGSTIRDNVKYCTQCGRSVLEIRNNIINNEKTERMKEQFKTVNNNVVENVKNFDTEQAKQQTINFANNVKTDVKNFKTLSVKKKRIYIIALIVVILIVFWVGKGIMNPSNNTEITTEQVISLMTQKDANGMPGIIATAEIRLRNELKYLDADKTYLFTYDYNVIGNTINFYIIAPDRTSYGYDIYGYKASYTITDDTIDYVSRLVNGSSNTGNSKTDDVFKINKEETMTKHPTTSDAYKDVIQYAIIPKLKGILSYTP